MLWHTTRLLAFVAATIVLSIAVAALVDQIASAHQTEEAEAPEHDPGREAPWPGSIAGDDRFQFRVHQSADRRRGATGP